MEAQSKPTERSLLMTLLIVVGAVAVIGLGTWGVFTLLDGGPVPADEARVEISFTGDGTTFVGDREIVAGTVTVTYSNDSDAASILYVMGYETGSDALADELQVVEEGGIVITGEPPTAGYFEVLYDQPVAPGTHTYTVDLEAGNTYLFDAGPEDFHQSGLWRLAVIEVFEP